MDQLFYIRRVRPSCRGGRIYQMMKKLKPMKDANPGLFFQNIYDIP